MYESTTAGPGSSSPWNASSSAPSVLTEDTAGTLRISGMRLVAARHPYADQLRLQRSVAQRVIPITPRIQQRAASRGEALLRSYAAQFDRAFHRDDMPEEPLGFEPEDYPLR
jgi:hypothetical protein